MLDRVLLVVQGWDSQNLLAVRIQVGQGCYFLVARILLVVLNRVVEVVRILLVVPNRVVGVHRLTILRVAVGFLLRSN